MGAVAKLKAGPVGDEQRQVAATPLVRMRSVLGMALEEYRLAKGLGLNELAELAGVRKLAAALAVEVDHLMRLAEASRRFPMTTAMLEVVDRAASGPVDVSAAIERDPTIPPERRRWLHECVALARAARR
jgi:hypothetical protein